MVAAVYGTDLTLIDDCEDVTAWSALGGGSAGLNDETDYFIEGTQCVSKNGFTAVTKGMIHDEVTLTIASGDAVFVWLKQNNRNLLDTVVNGGIQFVIGSSASDYDHFYVDGSDSDGSDLAGWRNYAIDPTQTPSATTGTPVDTTFLGVLFKILGSGSLKGAPNAIDISYHGRELQITEGFTVAAGTFAGAASADTTNRWGLFTEVAGGYQQHGAFVMGTTATAVDFEDSDRVIAVLDDLFVPAGFNEFEIRNASSTVAWTNITISALGTTSPYLLTLDVGTFTGEGCSFTGASTTTFASTGSMIDSQWKSCDRINLNEADISGSSILTSTVVADEGAIFDDRTTTALTVISELDNCTISIGAASHHAIRFGTGVDDDITLTGIEFTGFSGTADATNATLRFDATAGTMNVNLINCTVDGAAATSSNVGVDDAAGVTVTLVINPVTLLVNVKDNTGVNLQNARVYAKASDGTGDFPFEDSVTITRAGTVATVTHTAHGMNTGEKIKLAGITDKTEDNNGVQTITVTGANTYTYVTTDSGSTSYTGTITATGVLIEGLTDASGNISFARTFTLDQPFDGFVRKSTASPRFKTFNIAGTVDNANGATVNVRMILDE